MKLVDSSTEVDVDLQVNAFLCFECGDGLVMLDEPTDDPESLECDNDPGHAVEWLYVSDRPLFSPNAILDGRSWENLEPVDADGWHWGHRQFEYELRS